MAVKETRQEEESAGKAYLSLQGRNLLSSGDCIDLMGSYEGQVIERVFELGFRKGGAGSEGRNHKIFLANAIAQSLHSCARRFQQTVQRGHGVGKIGNSIVERLIAG